MAFSYNAQLEEWRVREYEKNVYIAAQQMDSRLAGHAMWSVQHSKMKSYDVLGSTTAIEKTGRYGDTPNIDVDHARRSIVLKEYEWGKLIDESDVLRTINDPTNPYTKIMSYAFMRKKDDIFIDKALGNALDGEDGGTSTALPTAQHIASVSGGAFSGLNIDALRLAAYKFDSNDLIDPEEQRYFAVTAKQLQDLLKTTEVTSADYNVVKALVNGKVDSFMGFKFILCNRLDTESEAVKYDLTTGEYSAGGSSGVDNRRCIAWVASGMKMTTGIGFSADIRPRPDKRNVPQIYGKMSIGGVRMEDVKVVEINCNE